MKETLIKSLLCPVYLLFCNKTLASLPTKTPSCNVLVFDYIKHPSKSDPSSEHNPDFIYVDIRRKAIGFLGPKTQWTLTECFWWPQYLPMGHQCPEDHIYWKYSHTRWCLLAPATCISVWVSCWRWEMIWDTGSSNTSKPSHSVDAHAAKVNCLSLNPYSELILAIS